MYPSPVVLVGSPIPGTVIEGVPVLPRGAIGRIRITRIPDCSEETLTGFVAAAAELGAVVYTDHWPGNNGLAGAGFQHWPTNISASGDPAHAAMPRVHRVASLLKRWLLGTHHGGVKPGQLDAYSQEFVFRFNRRTSRQRGLVFYRLLQQAMQVDPSRSLDSSPGARKRRTASRGVMGIRLCSH